MKPSHSTPQHDAYHPLARSIWRTLMAWPDSSDVGVAFSRAEWEIVIAALNAVAVSESALRLPKPGEEWPPKDQNAKLYVLPEDTINLIQSTLGYYCSSDTWLGARTGGVLQGCPRGTPDIHRDGGDYAGQAYARLVSHYPLKEVK